MCRNFKLILLCVFHSVLLGNCLNSKEVVSPDDALIVVPPEVAPKINWGPVWDDNQGNNEFVARISADSAEICQSPNGLGLENLLRELNNILPIKQINDIVKSYDEDPELKALKGFMKSAQTQEKRKVIRSSPEYQILKDYVCRVLHIDLNKYNKLIKTLIEPHLKRTSTKPRRGIRGLIDEVNAVLPHQQLHDIYKDLLASDEELAKAVDSLKSEEFHQLLLNLKNNVAEYQQLRQELIALGVPLEEMDQLLVTTMGWAPILTFVP